MAAFREALEAKFKLVNERIARGENKYIKLKAAGEKRCWSLIYPIEEEPINSSFYSQLPGIGIANLLWFVATKTGFLRGLYTRSRIIYKLVGPRGVDRTNICRKIGRRAAPIRQIEFVEPGPALHLLKLRGLCINHADILLSIRNPAARYSFVRRSAKIRRSRCICQLNPCTD